MLKYLCFILTFNAYAIDLESVIKKYKSTDAVPQLETSVSFIENVEIRVGTEQNRENENIDNDIQMRFSLNGLKEQRQKEKLHLNQQKRLEANRTVALNEELALVYKLYLKLHFGLQEKNKLQKLLDISKDRVRVTNVLVKKNQATITDLVAIEQKINEVKNKLIIKKTELNKTLALLNRLLGEKYSLKDISLNEKLLNYKRIASTVSGDKDQADKIDLEVERANLEYQLEVGENSKVLDFFQLEMKKNNAVSNNGDEEENSIGFSVALNLPFFRDKTTVNEKFINKLKAEYQAKFNSKAFVAEIDELKLNILSFSESLDQLTKSSYLTKTQKYLNIYKRSKGIEPLKLLELNNTLVLGQIEKIQLQSNLYFTYISYLKEKGTLANFANQNVLSRNFKGEV